MKKHPTKFAFLALLLLPIWISSCTEPNESPASMPTLAYDMPSGGYVFEIDNNSSDSVGLVTITGTMESSELLVGPTGAYDTTIGFEVTSVTINTIICPYPDTTIVPLGTDQAKVFYTTPNLVEVVNLKQQN